MLRGTLPALSLASLLIGACTDTEVLGRYPRPDRDAGATGSASDAAPPSPAPDDPAAHRGKLLLLENFDDADFADRGWYDGPGGQLTDDAVDGRAFECVLSTPGGCPRPGRIAFDVQQNVYVSYWIRFSAEYDLNSEVDQAFLLTDQDREYVGPGLSHLTIVAGQTAQWARVGVIDSTNVDLGCVRVNDGSFRGCDSFDDYTFGEARSVNACNGVTGNPSEASCSPNDFGGYFSFRGFHSDVPAFQNESGPHDKTEWHFVELLVELNSVAQGIGQSDGRLRYWLDGEKLVDAQRLVLRTGQFPDMHFQHLLVAPIEVQSSRDQRLYLDDLTVATGIP